jgi:putative peptidoglycan lipid II flippase
MVKQGRKTRRLQGAALVAAGIMLSRLAGLLRECVFARYFGSSMAADAFRAALRIPNFLQNLFGEGVLSASFIPVYAGLLEEGKEAEAGRVAGAVFALLALLMSALVLIGVLATPLLIAVIAPGFHGEKRELTIFLVRILFPGTGLLALSAWCLGILNSHRRFLLSYSAPVAWNAVMIGAMFAYGPHSDQTQLAVILAWAALIGSAAQFLVQLPAALRLEPKLKIRLATELKGVRTAARNAVPAFIARGVAQISAYIDAVIASLLPTGAVAALGYAQTLYLLPVSLFGMSVSAAELPEMSRAAAAGGESAAQLRKRLDSGRRRIALLVIPSAMAFLALGDVVAGAVYQGGAFGRADTVYVWGILAGSAVGLLASTLARLYSSAFYALKDTRAPLRFALIRVALTAALGYGGALPLPHLLGLDPKWGVAGLTASAGISGWVEYVLLSKALEKKIGAIPAQGLFIARLWAAAALAAAAAFAVKSNLPGLGPIPLAIATLGPFGVIYLLLAGPDNVKALLRARER